MLEQNGIKAVGPKLQNIKRKMKGSSAGDWSLAMNELQELFNQEGVEVTTEISNERFNLIPKEASSGNEEKFLVNLSVTYKFTDLKSNAFITAPMASQGMDWNKREAVSRALDNADRWYFSMLFDLPFREKIAD